jgi:DNA-binding FadR family transcriptional regulator
MSELLDNAYKLQETMDLQAKAVMELEAAMIAAGRVTKADLIRIKQQMESEQCDQAL